MMPQQPQLSGLTGGSTIRRQQTGEMVLIPAESCPIGTLLEDEKRANGRYRLFYHLEEAIFVIIVGGIGC
jgi:hypothetical protein